MKRLRKYHKWIGIIMIFFLIMFAWSGIVMNHRKAFSEIDVSRSILPKEYQFANWNNGAVKGSIRLSADSILLYGAAGIWLTDSLRTNFNDFTKGLHKGADNRMVSRIVKTNSGNMFASTTFDLYRLDSDNGWKNITMLLDLDERLSDLEVRGDTLVVLSRSHLYFTSAPYTHFLKLELPAPEDYVAETTLFRTIWLLHSGELFGMAGKIVVDALGILLIILSVTGIIYFFSPKIMKRKKRSENKRKLGKLMKRSLRWHNKIGSIGLILFLILTLSGMFLRPPLLMTTVRTKVANLPYSTLDHPNAWNDKLRTIRYDKHHHRWIIYASSGFYHLTDLNFTPQKISSIPPVSVMGMTVMEPMGSNWMIGSFNGMYLWNVETGKSIDFFSGQAPVRNMGRRVSSTPISGYSGDFSTPVAFEYGIGAYSLDGNRDFIPMPETMKDSRMSLFLLALETHTGRIYSPLIGGYSDVFLFISGSVLIFILLSGYIVYRKKHRKKKKQKQ